MISLLVLPFLACISLVLIHVYFGSLVLRRGVIFIDLALAQWAALGFLLGHYLHIHSSPGLFMMAFLFTVLAACILSLVKNVYDKINLQEAVIGVMYITAITLSTSLISSTGMEGHHLKEMLSGHLLFIQAPELISAFVIYSILGVILFFCHKALLNIRSQGWDFIFYILFGLVVTSSVKMVGVLLVFAYLVLPTLTSYLFSKVYKTQLLFGWGIGVLASVAGLGLSFWVDIPPSYCVILSLIALWFGSLIFKTLKT